MNNRCIAFILIGFAVLQLGGQVEASNASITIAKPGISVHRWDSSRISNDYLADGGLRIGNLSIYTYKPVYRIKIPKLGPISALSLRITATEHNSGSNEGTDFNVGDEGITYTYPNGGVSSYTLGPSGSVNEWIQGETDADTLMDYIEITFDNTAGDNIEIFELAMTIEYANISAENSDLVGKFQLLYNLFSILTTYYDNMASYVYMPEPPLRSIALSTSEELVREGIEKTIAVAEALYKLDGVDITGAGAIGSWGEWIEYASDTKSSYESIWGLWGSIVDFINTIPNASLPGYVGTLDIYGNDIADKIEEITPLIENLLTVWRAAVIDDGRIDGIEQDAINSILDGDFGVIMKLNYLTGNNEGITRFSDYVLQYRNDYPSYCRTHMQLLNPLKTYTENWINTSYLLKDYYLMLEDASFAHSMAYSGGHGTSGNPYRISTPQDLINLGNITDDYDKHFILTNDIDLAGYTFNTAVVAPAVLSGDDVEYIWFTGVFDGAGFSIKNMTINGNAGNYYLGLFGLVYLNGEVKNLGVENINITGGIDSSCLGGLCAANAGTIVNCYAIGNVTGDGFYVGGLCGWNASTINNCYATGSVIGNDYVGGLCGYNEYESQFGFNSDITCCYSTGNVTGNDYVGGLCGHNEDGFITNCYTTGNVNGSGKVGGLCGSTDDGTIANCYATGSVTGNDYVGGVCGYNSNSNIATCYSIGSVSGSNYLGGVCGGVRDHYSYVYNCFWNTEIQTGGVTVGVGNSGGTITNVFGKTTLEMQTKSTYVDWRWNCWNWYMPINDYPELYWEQNEVIPEVVYFADPNLKAAVEAKLGITDPTTYDMLGLTFLVASDNGIIDLTGLEYATNLRYLNLCYNQISDISEVAGLSNLTFLHLAANPLDDITAVSGLTNLSILYLYYTQINDFDTLAISNLTNLRTLDLWSNQISETSFLSDLTDLTYLDLGSNNISDITAVAGLTNLTTLYLSWNPLNLAAHCTYLPIIEANNPGISISYDSNPYPPEYCLSVEIPDANLKAAIESALGVNDPLREDMLELTYLSARSSGITDMTGIEYATNLTWLDLYQNQISDISAVSELTNLTVLRLYWNQISDISAVADLTNLTWLELGQNQISDISAIAGLTNLTSLSLFNDRLISNISAVAGLTNLTSLDLGANQINDISAVAGLSNLTVLRLYRNQISDISALTDLTPLDTLNLENNPLNSAAYCNYIPLIRTNNPGIDLSYDSNPNPLTLDCSTDLADLAGFVDGWLESGCDESNNWCGGADIDHINDVDMNDFVEFARYWLVAP